MKKSKKNPVNFCAFLARANNIARRRAARLPGSKQVKLALYQKYLFTFPHPLYLEVDRMMVMDVKCNKVNHFLVLYVVSESVPGTEKYQTGYKKVSDFNSDLMILYRIERRMSNF